MTTILNNFHDEEFLDNLFTKELIVYEDIKGYQIFVKWDGEDFLIKSEFDSEPINIIDDSVESFFGKAFNYLNSLSNRVKSLLNKKVWYVFQYFPNEEIIYNRKPKNNLVLTSIFRANKYIHTVEQIEEFSRLLEVECLPFIFKGKLSEKTIHAIKYFLNTSENDLEYIFGEKSFSFFFYKLLNPQLSHSFLNDDFGLNIERIILKVENEEENFAILNPLYNRISNINSTEYAEIFSLILVNFISYCQSININKVVLKGETRDDIYTYFICKLFNAYIEEVKDDILNFDFIIPEFFNKAKFRINIETIFDKKTQQFLEEPKFEYIFKCIYFSLRYQMKEEIGILTGNMLNILNKYIMDINTCIDIFLNKKNEFELGKKGLVAFGDFFDIKYDKDAEGTVYPDIYDEIMSGGDKKKKLNIGLKK